MTLLLIGAYIGIGLAFMVFHSFFAILGNDATALFIGFFLCPLFWPLYVLKMIFRR